MKNNEELKNLALRIAHFIGEMDEEAASWKERTQEDSLGLEKKFENNTKNR